MVLLMVHVPDGATDIAPEEPHNGAYAIAPDGATDDGSY